MYTFIPSYHDKTSKKMNASLSAILIKIVRLLYHDDSFDFLIASHDSMNASLSAILIKIVRLLYQKVQNIKILTFFILSNHEVIDKNNLNSEISFFGMADFLFPCLILSPLFPHQNFP